MKLAIDAYRQLKLSIMTHYDFFIIAKKKKWVSLDRDTIKDFKLSKIKAKKDLKEFNKKHK